MKCRRCGDICDDCDGSGSIVKFCYDWETALCLQCLDDYLLYFMQSIANLEIETDVLEAAMRIKDHTLQTLQYVKDQSSTVNAMQTKLIKEIIMWVRAGN